MLVGAVGSILVDVAEEFPVMVELPDIVELPETVAFPDCVPLPADADADGAGVIVNTKVWVTVLSCLLGPKVIACEKDVESWTDCEPDCLD